MGGGCDGETGVGNQPSEGERDGTGVIVCDCTRACTGGSASAPLAWCLSWAFSMRRSVISAACAQGGGGGHIAGAGEFNDTVTTKPVGAYKRTAARMSAEELCNDDNSRFSVEISRSLATSSSLQTTRPGCTGAGVPQRL